MIGKFIFRPRSFVSVLIHEAIEFSISRAFNSIFQNEKVLKIDVVIQKLKSEPLKKPLKNPYNGPIKTLFKS